MSARVSKARGRPTRACTSLRLPLSSLENNFSQGTFLGNSHRDPKELKVQSVEGLLEHVTQIQALGNQVDCTLSVWHPRSLHEEHHQTHKAQGLGEEVLRVAHSGRENSHEMKQARNRHVDDARSAQRQKRFLLGHVLEGGDDNSPPTQRRRR